MVDYAVQRTNMVESQVRPSDVTDRRILRAMLDLPREQFVPGPARAMAYMDDHLSVGESGGRRRFLLEPRTLAKLIQLLELQDSCSVLDIGCATGYSTALLARLAGSVVAVEEDPVLAERARKTLRELGVANAEVLTGALVAGAADRAPFDAILINGSVSEELPAGILDQLKDGGRAVAVLSRGAVGKATLWHRSGSHTDSRPIFDAGAPLLPGFEAVAGFVF